MFFITIYQSAIWKTNRKRTEVHEYHDLMTTIWYSVAIPLTADWVWKGAWPIVSCHIPLPWVTFFLVIYFYYFMKQAITTARDMDPFYSVGNIWQDLALCKNTDCQTPPGCLGECAAVGLGSFKGSAYEKILEEMSLPSVRAMVFPKPKSFFHNLDNSPIHTRSVMETRFWQHYKFTLCYNHPNWHIPIPLRMSGQPWKDTSPKFIFAIIISSLAKQL